jgi:DNA-binding IclR family transcriptional regulator
MELSRSQFSITLLDSLFDRPIFYASEFIERTGLPRSTGLVFLNRLRDAGILIVIRESGGRKSTLYAFKDLLNCAEGRIVL